MHTEKQEEWHHRLVVLLVVHFFGAPTGESGGFTNIIEFTQIATTGNATDFGDLGRSASMGVNVLTVMEVYNV